MHKIIVFDMDGTLTISKSKADDEMIELLEKLSNKYKVSVISGGNFNQFQLQFLSHLDPAKAKLDNFYLFPTNGTKMLYYYNDGFVEKYSEDLSTAEINKIETVLNSAIKDLNLIPEKQYGTMIDKRGTQITFAGIGKDAPYEVKSIWDKDRKKREKIVDYISEDLKDFNLLIAATSSIDITRKGIDKAYGIRKIMDNLGIEKEEILFIGDCLFEGGNDYPVKAFGVETIQVDSINDTKKIIKSLIN